MTLSGVENEGKSESIHSRAVLTSDEVGVLGKNVMVAFLQGERPLVLRRLSYFNHKYWKGKFAGSVESVEKGRDFGERGLIFDTLRH